MDMQEARRLSDITNEFYRTVHASFSATRQAPWPGWERVAEVAFSGADGLRTTGGTREAIGSRTDDSADALREADGLRAGDSREAGTADGPQPFDVLDLACGNLRFERFLAGRVSNARVWAADICDELVELAPADDLSELHYQHVDLASDPSAVVAPACDLCVSFGFMHHLPSTEQRMAVLRTLVDHMRPGGFVAVSFWQFARDERLRAKATPLAEPGDYLMGWQHEQGVQRYCHSYEEDEISALVAGLPAEVQEVARFSADGNLNRYVILGHQGVTP